MFRGHPPALRTLFFTEMWERFSYYGMRALLVLYMTQTLHWSMADASTIYGMYTGAVYLTPVIGGWLADRYLGLSRSILCGAMTMALGHLALAFEGIAPFYLGLLLVVIGCGLFKPCVSVLVGQLYAKDDARRDAGFSLFYMGINLGGFLAPIVCGTLGQTLGFHWGFASAGVGMLVSGLLFYVGFNPEDLVKDNAMASVNRSLMAATPSKQRAWPSLVVIAVLALFGNVAFWSAFEQAGSSLEIFVDRYVDMHVSLLHNANLSSLVQSINPLFIIALAPVFASLWQALHRRNLEPSAPTKFIIGLSLCAMSFAWMAMLGAQADAGHRVPLSMVSVALLLSTCAELCISPVGLSFVSSLAPPRYVSVLMGLWLASIALANVGSGTFASHFDEMPHKQFFGQIAFVCAGAALALTLVRPLLLRALSLPRPIVREGA